jgi:hypothetical protein
MAGFEVITEGVKNSEDTIAKSLACDLDWPPILRQTVKTHFSTNGELGHGIVSQAVH